MGAYTWIFFGFMPIGALWSGGMADRFGLSEAVIINGLIALAAAVAIWAFFPKLREH
jgi:predicted membrane-bound spermidine synthase